MAEFNWENMSVLLRELNLLSFTSLWLIYCNPSFLLQHLLVFGGTRADPFVPTAILGETEMHFLLILYGGCVKMQQT